MKKIILSILLCELSLSFIFSQESIIEDETQINLPEMTTTVMGDTITAGKDALPEFSEILPPASRGSEILPVLPGVESNSFEEEPVVDFGSGNERSVFAQGLIGAGLPGYFTGDFSIYKSAEQNPFSLEFYHLTQNGYGSNTAAEGFFNNNTFLKGNKSWSLNNFSFDFGGEYNTKTFGLQDESQIFYDLNSQTVDGIFEAEWTLPKGFLFTGKLDGEYYNRYGGIRDQEKCNTIFEQEKELKVFDMNPQLRIGWSNANFNTGFYMDYFIDSIVSSTEFASEDENQNEILNRFDIGFDFEWKNESLKICADAGFVFGKTDYDGSYWTVPFDVSFEGKWKIGSRSRILSVGIDGGLDSFAQKISSLENDFLWTVSSFVPSEQTDWFGTISVSIPFALFFSFDASAEYRKTAFDNKVMNADYDSNLISGLYGFEQTDRTLFDSSLMLSYIWNLFTFRGGLNSHWVFVPSNDYPQKIIAAVSYDSLKGNWGFAVEYNQPMGSGYDAVPLLNANLYWKLLDSITLSFYIEDAVKLVSSGSRKYMDSDFITYSGNASICAKFYF